jgi:hypothetical protein
MELFILIAVLWIIVLPAMTVGMLLSAPMLSRRRAEHAAGGLAPVVPVRPRVEPRRRSVA